MKIDIDSIDPINFLVNEHVLNGEVVYLVQPQHQGCSWNQSNKIFRSSVWNFDGELISVGFPKFTNWGENPEHFPLPNSLSNASIVNKLDGSLLIVSKYKNQFIIRTRGTIDATRLDNGHELVHFNPILEKLKTFNDNETWGFSFLFEWLSPTNVIVINYGDVPQFKLIGKIFHEDGRLCNQTDLDVIAAQYDIDRPEKYSFSDIDEMIAAVSGWKDLEGVVVYSKNDQFLHKIKAETYLKLHRFKSNATFENTVELFFEYGMPDYVTFREQLVAHFDWECFNMIQGFLSDICDGYKEVLKIVEGMKNFLENNKNLSRKDLAMKVFSSYGGENNNRASFVFTLKDRGELNKDQLKKLLFQVTKK